MAPSPARWVKHGAKRLPTRSPGLRAEPLPPASSSHNWIAKRPVSRYELSLHTREVAGSKPAAPILENMQISRDSPSRLRQQRSCVSGATAGAGGQYLGRPETCRSTIRALPRGGSSRRGSSWSWCRGRVRTRCQLLLKEKGSRSPTTHSSTASPGPDGAGWGILASALEITPFGRCRRPSPENTFLQAVVAHGGAAQPNKGGSN